MVPDISKLTRHILIEKPRVTKFQIDWEEDDELNIGVMPAFQQDQMQQQKDGQEQLMAKGTQGMDRNNMMSA